MANPRYLTKSRFKLGRECPTKLFYTKKKEYLDSKMDDAFLAALAEGGFQVGELAKCYHPNGHDIATLDYEEAEKQTKKLLKEDKVIIFEPAIRYKNLFIRIDILIKDGDNFELIEVKAKSFNKKEDEFVGKRGSILSGWRPYLEDVAFQKYVLSSKFPDANIESFLMMADKNALCSTDGLNQKFRIVRDEDSRKGCDVSNSLTKQDLKKKILIKVPVDDEIDLIMEDGTFVKEIKRLSLAYEKDEKIISDIGAHCSGCEFDCSIEEEKQGYKSGFRECWKDSLGWKDRDFEDPNVLEIWSFTGKDKLINDGRIKLSDLKIEDFEPITDGKPGVSASMRKWLQVEKVKNNDETPFFDAHGFKLEMDSWTYPLHFIDFETSMVAIPFNKGRRPYEAIAFQFSHHIVYKDGTVEHAGEYLNTEPGAFPNYEFLREFKRQLEGDNGTIFRYSPHENTFLNHIYRQLREDDSVADREELCEFIKIITTSSSSMAEKWEGERNMVDLWHLVKRYYYDPATRGSNSIKAVLPVILNSSDFLKEKYGKPIYGTSSGIKSLNFKNWQWLEIKDGKVVDPYKRLPKMFTDVSDKNLDLLTKDDELANGGAALTAYGRMQFSEMSECERKELSSALLRYCELDTMAMVMIFEAWREWQGEVDV
ncbi:PF11074 domain protein [Bacteriovorax sp. BSW11_IV]|uniref:DUF2779 domain-containing protein n=1 Tax=Bacteriovorax sp. BSW11_IV TaxID=1353529 RepID=UPI00038A5447|nr:DUF2779 domain-containing protein [Bacteriovorax sp. BSW11_IV]EQC45203.1 PF11074 domain protein [Bacteriovorax sp. BSW11_IV]